MTDWRSLCFELAAELSTCPLNYARGNLLRRVREAGGLMGLDNPLEVLELPKELYNPLRRAGYDTVELVEAAGVELLMRVNGLGPERVGQIFAAIRKWKTRP